MIWQPTGVPADARTRTRKRNAKRDYFAPPPGSPWLPSLLLVLLLLLCLSLFLLLLPHPFLLSLLLVSMLLSLLL